MTIDGSLDAAEREKVAHTLEEIGMAELIADVGAAIEDDSGDFNLFEECKVLSESLGGARNNVAPLIFRVVADVVASDRFVSSREAAYLSALARQIGISTEAAKQIFKEVMAERRGRLEVSGNQVDATLNPYLKELLTFSGSDQLVGAAPEDSIENLVHQAQDALAEGERISHDDLARALTILGLDLNANLSAAEGVWKDTIAHLDLPKMADLGETYVSAAIQRITRINDAYKTVLKFHLQYKVGQR